MNQNLKRLAVIRNWAKLKLLVFTAYLLGCTVSSGQAQDPDARVVLEKSIKYHDPHSRWNAAVLKIYIQEPRIDLPERSSQLILNNRIGHFELKRNHGGDVSTHIIDSLGNLEVLWNGTKEISLDVKEKYKLVPQNNLRFKSFYHRMYGLPMTLVNEKIETPKAKSVKFEGRDAWSIDIALEKPMISDHWRLYFSSINYELIGVKFLDEKAKTNEKIIFNDAININGTSLPRIRNWYDHSGEYLGSDIIVKQL